MALTSLKYSVGLAALITEILNITTINSFVTNCQNTLDYQIRSNIHKCRKCREESEIEIPAQNFSNVPILFMIE